MKNKILRLLHKDKCLVGLFFLGLYLFADMAEDVIEKEYILVIDRWISIHINDVQTPMINSLMLMLTDINSSVGFLVFSIALIGFFAYKKWYSDLWFYLHSVGGAVIAFTVMKLIVERVRPDSNLLDLTSYSFPSGHTTMVTVVALSIYFIFEKRVRLMHHRILLLFICTAWIFTISFSRVYLNVHWLSDVIAGFGLGLFWVTFLILWKKVYENS